MSQSLDDFLLLQTMYAALVRMDRAFSPRFVESRFRCDGVFLGSLITSRLSSALPTQALFPRRLGSPGACSARLVLSGVTVVCCALLISLGRYGDFQNLHIHNKTLIGCFLLHYFHR